MQLTMYMSSTVLVISDTEHMSEYGTGQQLANVSIRKCISKPLKDDGVLVPSLIESGPT